MLIQRRRVLQTLGTGPLLGLAGCSTIQHQGLSQYQVDQEAMSATRARTNDGGLALATATIARKQRTSRIQLWGYP